MLCGFIEVRLWVTIYGLRAALQAVPSRLDRGFEVVSVALFSVAVPSEEASRGLNDSVGREWGGIGVCLRGWASLEVNGQSVSKGQIGGM